MQWIERRHRLLKNHGHACTAHLAQGGFVQLCEVGPIQMDGARNFGALWQQAHHRQGCERFAATALANQTQGVALLHFKTHPPQSLDMAV